MHTSQNPTPIIVFGWHSPSAKTCLKNLQASGKIAIVAWFGNDEACTHRLNPLIHQFKIDESLKFNHPERTNLSGKELSTFLDMYSRVSRSRGLAFHELQHTAYSYYNYFLHLIHKNSVKLVIFSSPPHFGVDYMLYIAAQRLGAETMMCYQTLIPNRFFAFQKLEDFGNFKELNEKEKFNLEIKKKHEKNLFYMRHLKTKPTSSIISMVNDLRRNILRSSSKPMSFPGIIQKYDEARSWKSLYAKHAKTDISTTARFVYFPLQLQPEMTTSSLGNGYSDQITAIEILSRIIPKDWFIYIKENPKQTHRQRGEGFFKRLSGIPNAVYIDKSFDTYTLIKNAEFISTITGTAGWEAISGGKPALIFGQAWYQQLPGIVKYRADMAFDEIASCNFTHEELEKRYNELISRTLPGVMDPSYKDIVENYDETQNINHLTQFLQKVLSKELFEIEQKPH